MIKVKKSLFHAGVCEWCLVQPAEYELDTSGVQLELFGGNDIADKICWNCFKQATLAELGKIGSIIDFMA